MAQTYSGGCQCGKVRYEATFELGEVIACNCSRCGRLGSLLAFMPKDSFELLSGEGATTAYQFNKHLIHHRFCATCGIKAFYVPRSHPDGFSVNARCIDSATVTGMKIHPVDGRNWEQHYPAGRGEFTA